MSQASNRDFEATSGSPPFLPRTVVVGLVAAGIGCLLLQLIGGESAPGPAAIAAIALAYVGVVLAGLGIAANPKNFLVLGGAAATAAMARFATHPQWDSVQLLFDVMAAVTVAAMLVLCLPRSLQMAFVTGLAIFHFLGVLSAITSPPPQSWLTNWSWVTLFRPHLVFCYTNNAYQFYSPEPGPASLLWFCIERSDGEKVWYKMPRKPESRLDPLAVEYFRRLSLSETANQNMMITGPTQTTIEKRVARSDIPWDQSVTGIPLAAQYRVPQDNTRRWLSSYVRHIVEEFGGPEQIRSIRVYRVTHRMLNQKEFADGLDPFAPWTYWPYFLGEFTPDGRLAKPNDPMLYWLVPIVRKPAGMLPIVGPGSGPPVDIVNYLAYHAGSDPFAN